jgi:hypothetical protein
MKADCQPLELVNKHKQDGATCTYQCAAGRGPRSQHGLRCQVQAVVTMVGLLLSLLLCSCGRFHPLTASLSSCGGFASVGEAWFWS